MKRHRISVTLVLSAMLVLSAIFVVHSQGQNPKPAVAVGKNATNQADKVSSTGFATTVCGEFEEVDCEPNDLMVGAVSKFTFSAGAGARPPDADPILPCIPGTCFDPEEEAPAAFDDMTNGFVEQGDPITACSPAPTPGTFA